jgi:predicted NAD/FAD-binding protein
MNIAVIGGGIAGLVAAWRLSQRHAVTLFERHAVPGFTASSVAVNGQRVDVPLRVFYPGYYPTLTRLYAELGIAIEPVDYATTFTTGDGRPYFRWRNLRLAGWSWPFVLPRDVSGTRARRIVAGALRFNSRARAALADGALANASIGDFVAAEGIAPDFVDGLLLPAVATIGTCTTADARAYPAAVVAAYAGAGLSRQSVHRARDGADAVAQRLLRDIAQVVCSAGVDGVLRLPGGAMVRHRGGVQAFEHVVFATQANQALALLDDATAAERAVLGAFRYRPLDVVMHRDPSLMPARRADWSPVNAVVEPAFERPQSTIWINRVQPSMRDAAPLFQTVMPQAQPRDELVLGRARFERPLVDANSEGAIAALQRLHAEPGRRAWLCGSYAMPGVPLLESAVRSALAVADSIA